MLSCCASLRAAPEQASQADQLVDTIGINTHVSWLSSPYNDMNRVIGAINDLGIRYVRDDPSDVARLNQLTAATGAQVDLIMQDRETVEGTIDIEKLPSVIARAKQLTGLAFMEGPNEPENLSDWVNKIHAWQPALYQQVKADPQLAGKPLLMPSYFYWDFPQVQDLAQYADAGNLHHYPPGGGPPSYDLDFRNNVLHGYVGANKPLYITEGGYSNAINLPDGVVSETAAAKYYPAFYTEAFNHGFSKTVTYELIEETLDPSHTNREVFGLLRADWTPKPAYYAVKNFIALLGDRGASFAPAPLDYTLTANAPAGSPALHHTLLQKRDGSFYLAVWQDAQLYDGNAKADLNVPAIPITLDVAGGSIASAETFLPTTSASPTGQFGGPITQLNLSVPDQMLIVHITPAALRNWTLDAGGNWGDSSTWQNGVPVGTAVTARFGNTPTASPTRTVMLDTSRMVGNLVFDSTATSYTIAGTDTLTVDGGAGPGSIQVLGGNHGIAAPLALATATTLTVSPGLTLTLGNSVSAGGADVTITGGGHVVLSAGGNKLMKVGALAVSGAGSVLDLKDNRLIATAPGTVGTLAGLIAGGRVTSTTATAAGGLTSLGIATAAQVKGIAATETSTWSGQTVTGSDTLVMYTYGGDANLDGKINVDDYGRIDSSVALGISGWYNGDFNYDGKINVDDYGIIDSNIGIQGASFSTAGSVSAGLSTVPEPAAPLVPLSIFALTFFRCRLRKNA